MEKVCRDPRYTVNNKKRFFVLSSFLYSIIRSKKYLFFMSLGLSGDFLIFDASKLKYTNTHTNREIERALIRWRFKMNEKFLVCFDLPSFELVVGLLWCTWVSLGHNNLCSKKMSAAVELTGAPPL